MQIISFLGEAVCVGWQIIIDSAVNVGGGEHAASFYCGNEDLARHETLAVCGGAYCG